MKTVFVKYKGLFAAFLFFGLLTVMVPMAFGIGTLDSGWKIDPNQARAITAVGTSTQLTVVNSSTIPYFVPSKTANELKAFMDHHPLNVNVGYCGDGNCSANLGETACNGTSVGTCPIDCGVCTSVTTVNYDNFWFAYGTGFGPVCGDGRCDTLLGEKSSNCSTDCSPDKGCCAVRSASASKTSILTNCGIYEANSVFPNSSVTPCDNQPACTVINKSNLYNLSQNICVRNKNYPCNQISAATYNASPASYPNCQVSGGIVVAKQSCADITDAGSCRSNSACIWVGQSDSPMCNGYCGSGATDINPSNNRQTCPEDYGGTTNQCGDGNCISDYPDNETPNNCPADCITATTLKSDRTGGLKIIGSCGDGVCSTSEQGDGQASYCSTDCGYITSSGGSISQPKVDWGKCESFSTACPSLSQSDCAATHVCDWSINSISGCSISIYGSSLTLDNVCSSAKNRNDCNRIGCYWDKTALETSNDYCGDGLCNISSIGGTPTQETEDSCPVDCKTSSRSYYCQGQTECAKKTDKDTCRALSGCTWTAAGN